MGALYKGTKNKRPWILRAPKLIASRQGAIANAGTI